MTRLDPAVPMLAYAVAVAVSPEFEFLGLPKVRISDLLLPLLLMVFIGAAATEVRRKGQRRPPLPLVLPMIAVMVWDVAAWALFSEEGPRMTGLLYLVKRTEFFLVYLLGVVVVQSSWAWDRTIRLFVIASPILNLSVLWELASGSTRNFRASGIIGGQETSTALFIVVVLGLVTALWGAVKQPLERYSLLVSAITGALALLATGSRAGLLCALVVVGAHLWEDRRRRMGLVVLVLLAVGPAWFLLPGQLQQRFEAAPEEVVSTWRGLVEDPDLMPGAGSSSLAARALVAQHALTEVIPRGPWVGLGTARLPLGIVDDFYLAEWIYHGAVGLGLFMLLLFNIHGVLRRAALEARDPLQQGLARGLHHVLLAFLLAGLVAETFYLIRPMEAYMLLLGLTVGRMRLDEATA